MKIPGQRQILEGCEFRRDRADCIACDATLICLHVIRFDQRHLEPELRHGWLCWLAVTVSRATAAAPTVASTAAPTAAPAAAAPAAAVPAAAAPDAAAAAARHASLQDRTPIM